MTRDMDNPDRRAKDMDFSDTYTRLPCPDCRTSDPDDHGEGCRYADD